jgi:hypothetical protein
VNVKRFSLDFMKRIQARFAQLNKIINVGFEVLTAVVMKSASSAI